VEVIGMLAVQFGFQLIAEIVIDDSVVVVVVGLVAAVWEMINKHYWEKFYEFWNGLRV
jgi:hypothetical protein